MAFVKTRRLSLDIFIEHCMLQLFDNNSYLQ